MVEKFRVQSIATLLKIMRHLTISLDMIIKTSLDSKQTLQNKSPFKLETIYTMFDIFIFLNIVSRYRHKGIRLQCNRCD